MCSPFNNLTKLQITKLFDLLEIHIYKFSKNQEIEPTIKGGNIIGIILEGSAQIINFEYNGNEIILENLSKDSVFGTNFSPINLGNYEIIAKEDTKVLVIDYENLLNPENTKYVYFNIFLQNLFQIINSKFKKATERLKILEEKQIRNKLLTFFDIEYRKSALTYIELPFSLKDLADYLAVNRSAMFRELKSLKEEGFIEVHNRRIVLLYKNNGLDLDL